MLSKPRSYLLLPTLFLQGAIPLGAQEAPGPDEKIPYRTLGDTVLHLHAFHPKKAAVGEKAPAVVFFFGGGWNAGDPKQFYAQCRHLADRGIRAFSAEYRVKSRNGTSPVECVADGQAAVRWLRANAAKLGIDPQRIVAGGGSAGGHVAACVGLCPPAEPAEEKKTSSKVAALVLFNPAVDVTPEKIAARFPKGRAKEFSPLHHVAQGAPPTILFHGTADSAVPFASVQRFEKAMRAAGNVCELVGYEGRPHGFFNYRPGKKLEDYQDTVRRMDAFLAAVVEKK